ncbi:MAG: hypothetical protein H6710_07880 [Myxococcales bacterium]|nr:hypothetical protein [Myxococcales bacterium]MCB9704174.1 hypothetical protein [Myxococcales bacterium]
MIRAWDAWLRVLERREGGEALAVFRILSGLAILYTYIPVIAAGLVEIAWLDVEYGGYRPLTGKGSWLITALGGLTPELVWSLVGVGLVSGLALTLGVGGRVGGRIVAFVALQTLLALSMINGDAKGSYDALLNNSLWLLVLGDGTATLSLDARRRGGGWRSALEVAAWPRYLIIAQIITVYASTGIHKVSAFWLPMGGYTALYYILLQPTWHRWEMYWIAWLFPLTQLLTALTWIWEVSFPLVGIHLYLRQKPGPRGRLGRLLTRWDLRTPYVLFGVSMHLMIFALMEVGPFSLITLAYYPCLYRPEELRRGWARLRARLSRRPT